MELEKLKLPSKSYLLEHIKLYFEKNQQKKDLEKSLKEERSHFEEHVLTHCDGFLRVGNFEVVLSPMERTSFDLDFASKALSSEDFDKYVRPYMNKTLGTKLNVKRI